MRFHAMRCDAFHLYIPTTLHDSFQQEHIQHINEFYAIGVCMSVWVCVCGTLCAKLFTNELILMCTSYISVWFWIRICCFTQMNKFLKFCHRSVMAWSSSGCRWIFYHNKRNKVMLFDDDGVLHTLVLVC